MAASSRTRAGRIVRDHGCVPDCLTIDMERLRGAMRVPLLALTLRSVDYEKCSSITQQAAKGSGLRTRGLGVFANEGKRINLSRIAPDKRRTAVRYESHVRKAWTAA